MNLQQSLQWDIRLDDLTPSPLSKPLTAETVGSEQSERTNNCSSSVFDGLILNSGVGAYSVDDLSLCGGEPDRKMDSLLRDKYFRKDSRIRYLR